MGPPAIVIVAYRADDHLGRCLDALGPGADVLVVDNDASEETRSVVRARGAEYLPAPTNAGFAVGVNLGLAQRAGRDVLLLNPDARLSHAGVLELHRALHAAGDRRAAVGPLLVGEDGRSQPADWPVPSPTQVWADAFGLGRRAHGRRFITGAALLLHADAIAEIGGFDERYFLYAEEADWQLRAQRAGWSVAVVPTVTAVHAGAGSSSDPTVREQWFQASGRTFARRWYGSPGAAVMWLGSVVAGARRSVLGAADSRGHNRRMLARLGRRVPPVPGRPTVVHAIRSDSFAGVERLVVTDAGELHARGWRVVVVGGNPHRMRAALPAGVLVLPGSSTVQVLRSLRRVGRVDIVHAHMTAAEMAVLAARRRNRGRFVVTRHFAARRGSTVPARLGALLVRRLVDEQLSISEFVAGGIGEPSTVVVNGVAASVESAVDRERTVVVLHRLEREKATDVAIRAWTASALAADGWRLLVHGAGSLEAELRTLAAGVDGVEFAGFTETPRAVLAGAGMLLATAPGEPFGLSVVEAMAEGCPVVAADGGAHREVLGPGGVYFPPGDVDAAGAALRTVAMSASRTDMGRRLQARHAELFGVDRHVERLIAIYRDGPAPSVALLSLEPWDDVWRRNQHFARRVVASGAARSLVFVNPPRGGFAWRATRGTPCPGIEVVTPPLVVPRRLGGHRVLAVWLRRRLRGVDVLWVNDPVAGAGVLNERRPTVYDVTDDWRELDQAVTDRARIVAAENRLARRARTVVCSPELATRWHDRYGVEAPVIGNGVDLAALRSAPSITLPGPGPHVVYVGTVHPNRVDVDLLLELAAMAGTLHLVGPASLDAPLCAELTASGAQLVGPVPSTEVPAWLMAADVLVCPHLVDDFTRSLDAIKSYEYLATGAPVVATPSSGFAGTSAPGLTVVGRELFTDAVRAAAGTGPFARTDPPDWADRAAEFGAVLRTVARR